MVIPVNLKNAEREIPTSFPNAENAPELLRVVPDTNPSSALADMYLEKFAGGSDVELGVELGLGVALGVNDGVAEVEGVALGVKLGVAEGLGVELGLGV